MPNLLLDKLPIMVSWLALMLAAIGCTSDRSDYNNSLAKPTRPVYSIVIRAKVTEGQKPIGNAIVAMGRSISGKVRKISGSGRTNQFGWTTIPLEVSAEGQFWRTGLSGYYFIRVWDHSTGNVLGTWDSVPFNGNHDFQILHLSVKGEAKFVSTGFQLEFADPKIWQVIVEELGRPEGPLTTLDIPSIKSLGLFGLDIGDLSGMEVLTSLEELSLSGQVKDLTPISGLNLRRLYVEKLSVPDWSPIADIETLDELFLHNTGLKSIGFLGNLNRIGLVLSLSENQISDVEPLREFRDLRNLHLSKNLLRDISPLSGLESLINLEASDNQISDLSPLTSLTELQILRLSRNDIEDVTAVGSLTNLQLLYLDGNGISDISALEHLRNIRRIELQGNQISNLNPLIRNPGIDSEDIVILADNPLSEQALEIQIPALKARGVRVKM